MSDLTKMNAEPPWSDVTYLFFVVDSVPPPFYEPVTFGETKNEKPLWGKFKLGKRHQKKIESKNFPPVQ